MIANCLLYLPDCSSQLAIDCGDSIFTIPLHCKNESMKYIPKGVKYIPQVVHTIGMFCIHTKNGMLCISLYGMH